MQPANMFYILRHVVERIRSLIPNIKLTFQKVIVNKNCTVIKKSEDVSMEGGGPHTIIECPIFEGRTGNLHDL